MIHGACRCAFAALLTVILSLAGLVVSAVAAPAGWPGAGEAETPVRAPLMSSRGSEGEPTVVATVTVATTVTLAAPQPAATDLLATPAASAALTESLSAPVVELTTPTAVVDTPSPALQVGTPTSAPTMTSAAATLMPTSPSAPTATSTPPATPAAGAVQAAPTDMIRPTPTPPTPEGGNAALALIAIPLAIALTLAAGAGIVWLRRRQPAAAPAPTRTFAPELTSAPTRTFAPEPTSAPTPSKTLLSAPPPGAPYLRSVDRAPQPIYFPLGQPTVVIGRDPQCDLVIDESYPGWRTASRRHARIERDGADWVVVDARSENGIYINGQRSGQSLLRDGDVLSLGQVRFTFHLNRGGDV